MTESRLICVAGPDGSGKSTQAAQLVRAFADHGLSAAEVSIWDALDAGSRDVFAFTDKGDVYRYLRSLSSFCRTHFLFHAMHLSLDHARRDRPDVLILNAYWYKYYATEVAHGGDAVALRDLAAGFPVPDQTFYLRITPDTALGRKADPSDYESGYGGQDAFLSFQQRALDVLDGFASEMDWHTLDGRRSADELTSLIHSTIDVQ